MKIDTKKRKNSRCMLTGSYLCTNVLFWSNACTVGSTLPDSAIERQWVDMNCCAPPRAIGNPKQMIMDLLD